MLQMKMFTKTIYDWYISHNFNFHSLDIPDNLMYNDINKWCME